VRTGAEDAGEVKEHEDDHDGGDEDGHRQASMTAIGPRAVVVFRRAWHLVSSWL
jgi:hypothetical protein